MFVITHFCRNRRKTPKKLCFTGSGAYVSGSGGHTGGGGGLDPFTGSGAYTTTGSSSTPMDTTPAPSSVTYYPQVGPLLYKFTAITLLG